MLSDADIGRFLEITIQEASIALTEGNYPIGSLIIDTNATIISQKRNQCMTHNDVSAHAEILNLRDIGMTNKNQLIMFSSLEPCFGCSFFIARSGITKIYSALKDPHKGGISDLKHQTQFADFFKNIKVVNEPFEDLKKRSKELMRDYFLKQGRVDKAAYYGFTSVPN